MLLLKQQKKKSNYLFIIIGVILGVSFCIFNSYMNRFKDQKLHVKIADTLELLSVSTIEYGIVGKETVKYSPSLYYKEWNLHSVENEKPTGFGVWEEDSSTIDLQYKTKYFTLFSETAFLDTDSLLVAFVIDVLTDNTINLKLSMHSNSPIMEIDSVFSVYIKIPPVSNIRSIYGENIKETNFEISKWESEIRKQLPSKNELLIRKGVILCELLRRYNIRNNSTDRINPLVRFTYDSYDNNVLGIAWQLPVINNKDKNISVSVIVDTIYDNTYIIPYYSCLNNAYWNSLMQDDSLDRSVVNSFLASYYKNYQEVEKVNNGYLIKSDFKKIPWLPGNGPMGIYLVNIDASGSYFFHEIANFIIDNSPPNFYENKDQEFYGNPVYQGLLSLNPEQFGACSNCNVPFVGYAYGDIKEIYIDGKKVNFEIGKEIYFRRNMNLGFGYNRVPVKLVDHNGNVGEYKIEITMVRMKDNE